MDNKSILGLAALAAVGGIMYYVSKKTAVEAAGETVWNWPFDPRYMAENPNTPYETVSTDDYGGSLEVIEHTIGAPPYHVPRNARESRPRINIDTRNRKVEVDYPTFTGGTFVHPEFLPPTRTYQIQGGRLVNPGFLPPEREIFIQRLGSLRRGEG